MFNIIFHIVFLCPGEGYHLVKKETYCMLNTQENVAANMKTTKVKCCCEKCNQQKQKEKLSIEKCDKVKRTKSSKKEKHNASLNKPNVNFHEGNYQFKKHTVSDSR